MERAIMLSELGRQTAAPNPWVGCVIVKNNNIIGEGYHQYYGGDHAEINAISKGNKDLIKKSTFYVTLEPCHHYGKPPPCDKLLVEYEIEKVIIGYIDPDIKVNSSGIEYLRQNGIIVEIDELNHNLVFGSLKSYLYQRKVGLPYCIIKSAISIDGYIATYSGDSKWISNEKSRKDVQKLRSESHAIIVGSNTVLKDNPMLTVRDDSLKINKQPLRVILDTWGKISDTNLNILKSEMAPTIIFTSKEPKNRIEGISYKITGVKNNKLDLLEVMSHLNDIGIIQCLIEGGASVYTSFLEEKLVQEVYLYRSNVILGLSGLNWMNCLGNSSINNNKRWDLIDVKIFDNDILSRYKVLEDSNNDTPTLKNNLDDALNALRNGKPVIVMDNQDRENEGDLVIPAELITPDIVAFMMRYTTGIICVTLTQERANNLKLNLMVNKNEDPNGTNFTVSCDAKGSHTGISAEERAKTIKLLSDDTSVPSDFTRPCHVFPLIAHKNGLLSRKGHTEASVTLCQLAGLKPIAAIAELVNCDGTVMKYNNCELFARKYNIPLITIDDMIKYNNPEEVQISSSEEEFLPVAECNIMTKEYGEWKLLCYPSNSDISSFSSIHRVMIKNIDKIKTENIIVVRVHSDCYTGDTLGSVLCDCGDQLELSFKIINDKGVGIIIFPANHEGRGIGLVNKIKAYNLISNKGYDTFKANNVLGFDDDLRNYDIVPKILDKLKINQIEILTNNKNKILQLQKYIITVTPLSVNYNKYNISYMETKTIKYGHKKLIPEDTINVSKCESDKYSIGIIITNWHNILLDQVKNKIIETLNEHYVTEIKEYIVPGAFEIPFAVKTIIQNHNTIICIGLIMKGDTAHFEYISQATISGLMNIQLKSNIPIINGILNCYNIEQAKERCDTNSGFGIPLAKSTISMIKLLDTFEK